MYKYGQKVIINGVKAALDVTDNDGNSPPVGFLWVRRRNPEFEDLGLEYGISGELIGVVNANSKEFFSETNPENMKIALHEPRHIEIIYKVEFKKLSLKYKLLTIFNLLFTR